MARQQIVAGNWKMNKTIAEGNELVQAVLSKNLDAGTCVVFATPFVNLTAVAALLKGKKGVHLAAQNVHQEEKGAFTGEVSADMLVAAGCEFAIIGHSERRQYFGETNAQLAQKVNISLKKGLKPIFCCGEPLAIREKGKHVAFVAKQLKESLFHLSDDEIKGFIIAYEPIWAIGTGVTASTEQAQEMHAALRKLLARKFGKRAANSISILYGGSCNAQNAAELFSQPDIDGGLIGGASLKADDFSTIINSFPKK